MHSALDHMAVPFCLENGMTTVPPPPSWQLSGRCIKLRHLTPPVGPTVADEADGAVQNRK